MTVVAPLDNGPRTSSTNDQRITVCKLCLFSILVGQPKVWLTAPMGLSHTVCAGRVGLAALAGR